MQNNNKKNNRINALTENSLLIALAFVLSLFELKFLPYGGSITFASMVPIILISYRRGIKWGLISAFVFGLLNMFTGISGVGGMSPFSTIMILFLDYILAYTMIGFGGLFRYKIESKRVALSLGAFVSIFLRFLCHFVSGYIFFSEYAEWFFGETGEFGRTIMATFTGNSLSVIYSIIYNSTYIIPEMIISIIVCLFLSFSGRIVEIKE
ncbi:MAG: hypothetical protein GX222_06100 [Ruminococcaceae bacterium]|nr:hypothetical protein [Oscillospiraceae bacterium]